MGKGTRAQLMEIHFKKADRTNAQQIHDMQVAAFLPLYEKYRDEETSPVTAGIEKVREKLSEADSDTLLIEDDGRDVGAIRIKKITDTCRRISAFFILPEFQNRGIAQQVIAQIEADYPDAAVWELDTILQETRNCYLYEKVGYRRAGESRIINERMTLVGMRK
ncbi:MAG: GNAT family N-acetyltransferase [Anaerofustis sp.]